MGNGICSDNQADLKPKVVINKVQLRGTASTTADDSTSSGFINNGPVSR
jgi:hypothetical protein